MSKQLGTEFNDEQSAIIIAALRHLQRAIENGDDLTALSDICDFGRVEATAIDEICEGINFGDLRVVQNSYTDDQAYTSAKSKAQLAANESGKKMVLGYSNYAGWCHVDATDVNGVAELGDASVIEPENNNSEAS